MRIQILALGLVCAAGLSGQHRFNWQNYCFDHPAAPFCPGHEYAIKKPKDGASRNAVTNPFPSTPQSVTPNLIVVSSIDWRFADPSADALVGFNLKAMSTSPLAGSLITQLGAAQGLTEADMQKIFDRLSGVEQVTLSVRGNQIVAMVSGAYRFNSSRAGGRLESRADFRERDADRACRRGGSGAPAHRDERPAG